MKKQILILILLITSISVHSQTATERIKNEFLAYFENIINHDFNKSLGYMPKEMFDITPRASLLETMESALNNPQMPLSFKDVKVISIDEPILVEEKHYSLLKYSTVLSITVKPSSPLANVDSTKLLNVYKETYSEENVKFFAEDNRYDIYYEKNVCAISLNGKTDWKFVELEPTILELLKEFIPDQILNKL